MPSVWNCYRKTRALRQANNESVYPPDPMLREDENEIPDDEDDFRHVLIRLNDLGRKIQKW